jgi:diguanylate cyclase
MEGSDARSASRGTVPYEELLGADFQRASVAVLRFLRQRLGFGLWMVTRTDDDDWIVLAAEDHGYGVAPGDLFRWSDSFCSRMVRGLGPRVAPRSEDVPVYAEAPIGRQVPIQAYIGVPIADPDGALFGTLCAIDPAPQPSTIVAEQPLVELLAGLLGNILASEREREEAARRAERAEHDSQIDELTGLGNRRGWEHVLDAEEARSRRYGDPAAVLVLDLDGLKVTNDTLGHAAGDELLRRTALTLREVVREPDYLARVGGDEFSLLALRCGPAAARQLSSRLRAHLTAMGVEASFGSALRHPSRGLRAAWSEADAAMYVDKRVRAASRAG